VLLHATHAYKYELCKSTLKLSPCESARLRHAKTLQRTLQGRTTSPTTIPLQGAIYIERALHIAQHCKVPVACTNQLCCSACVRCSCMTACARSRAPSMRQLYYIAIQQLSLPKSICTSPFGRLCCLHMPIRPWPPITHAHESPHVSNLHLAAWLPARCSGAQLAVLSA
jgi:hypothetical protein